MSRTKNESPVELSIIIVDFKSGQHLQNLLKSLPKRDDWEIVVVDNNKENVGFGEGCNRGASRAKGKYLLFMNPDVFIWARAIDIMIDYLKKHPKVGIVGPQFVNSEHKIEQSSTQHPTFLRSLVALSFIDKLFPKNRISRAYWMRDWDRTTTRKVDVVSGAAMMMRAKDFTDIGAFDSHFFLYWEEFDICRRMQRYGKDTVYIAEARADHPREVSIKQSDLDTAQISHRSRFLYLKKFLGVFPACVLELWFVFTEQWRLLLLFGMSMYMRTVDIFHIDLIGDVGRDYLKALVLIQGKEFVLLGIPSSIPKFAQGPLNVWFDAMSFILAGVSPFSPVLFSAVVTSLGVGLLYVLLERHLQKNVAFFASLLAVFSPALILQSRMPFYLFAVPTFTVLFLMHCVNTRLKTGRDVSLIVFLFCLLFQWELATLPLGILVLLTLRRIGRKIFRYWKEGVAAVIFGLFPQIIYDVTHHCAQLCGVALWAGYRVAAVTGFDGRHTMSIEQFKNTLFTVFYQLHRLIGVQEMWSTVVVCALIIVTVFICMFRKKMPRLFGYTLITSLTLLLGIMIHGSPSEAYFPPFGILIPILVAYAASILPKKISLVICVLILGLSTRNAYLLLHHHFYVKPVTDKIEAVRWIVKDAQNMEIHLKSYDSPAAVPTYLDQYRFLVRTYGGRLNDTGRSYIIAAEEGVILPSIDVEKRQFGSIIVVKKVTQ